MNRSSFGMACWVRTGSVRVALTVKLSDSLLNGLTGSELLKREASFCTFRPLNILMCTWNVDDATPDMLTGAENTNFFKAHLQSMESPDIIIFGFQEVVDLENHKITASALLLFLYTGVLISFTYTHSAHRVCIHGQKQETGRRTNI